MWSLVSCHAGAKIAYFGHSVRGPILFCVFLSTILTSLSIFKSYKILFNLLNTDSILWRILLFYYLNARNLVDEALNQRKMIFWFNLEKNNLKDIANYPCISYLKFLWYRRNQMLWDRFNQQNDENKILGWKRKIK